MELLGVVGHPSGGFTLLTGDEQTCCPAAHRRSPEMESDSRDRPSAISSAFSIMPDRLDKSVPLMLLVVAPLILSAVWPSSLHLLLLP